MRARITVAVVTCLSMSAGDQPTRSQNATLTAVPGLKVGHFTLSQRPTGCTVILAESGAIGGVDVRGSAPGTRETDLLNPVNTVEQVHAVVLAGGSAFGLDAASGVMRYLDERGIGFKVVSHGIPVTVPIVPAAVLIDLGVGGNPKVRPDAQCGYQAAVAATDAPVTEGLCRRRRRRDRRETRWISASHERRTGHGRSPHVGRSRRRRDRRGQRVG